MSLLLSTLSAIPPCANVYGTCLYGGPCNLASICPPMASICPPNLENLQPMPLVGDVQLAERQAFTAPPVHISGTFMCSFHRQALVPHDRLPNNRKQHYDRAFGLHRTCLMECRCTLSHRRLNKRWTVFSSSLKLSYFCESHQSCGRREGCRCSS